MLLSLAVLVALGGVVLLAGLTSGGGRRAPRFVPGTPAGAAANLVGATYNAWGEDVPFQHDRIWVWTINNPTNFHTYWVSLDYRSVVGELLNAGEAEFSNADGTKLLCSGQGAVFTDWKAELIIWLGRITGKGMAPQLNRKEDFWILDLCNNRAKRIGGFSQYPGTGSRWHPAPGFRFGYNVPSTSSGSGEFYLCDLQEEHMARMQFAGDIQGWWDERRLLMKDSHSNFLLYDVLTKQTNLLYSAEDLRYYLQESQLPRALDGLSATPVWTGTGYTFHFSARTNWINGRSWVLWAEKGESHFELLSRDTATNTIPNGDAPGPPLEVSQRDFPFEWLGRFNSDCTLYVFPGESGQPGSGGDGSVHLRDVRTGQTRVLVESDRSGQYTLPRFYKDRIIYVKARQLWSIGVDGSSNTKLFELPSDKASDPE